MTARDDESVLLARCAAIARGEADPLARDQREANVLRLASMVMLASQPQASEKWKQASEAYFARHPSDQLAPADVVRKGWVFSLPRLRDMLRWQLLPR